MASTPPARVFILHDNAAWLAPLEAALEELGVSFEAWHLGESSGEQSFDLGAVPPDAVVYNRVSPSSHTRSARYSCEYASVVLGWVEASGRTVVNGSNALRFEVNKALQAAELQRAGVQTPRTVVAGSLQAQVLAAAERHFPDSDGVAFMTKHNRAGSGYGIALHHSLAELKAYLDGDSFVPSVDGVTLLQEYVASDDGFITRMEFVNGKFLYAVRVRTDDKSFNLCPADACDVGPFGACPVSAGPRFSIVPDFESPLIAKMEKFLATHRIDVAGVEFIVDRDGQPLVYDVNANTNYNGEAEAAAELAAEATGMGAIARLLHSHVASKTPAAKGKSPVRQDVAGSTRQVAVQA